MPSVPPAATHPGVARRRQHAQRVGQRRQAGREDDRQRDLQRRVPEEHRGRLRHVVNAVLGRHRRTGHVDRAIPPMSQGGTDSRGCGGRDHRTHDQRSGQHRPAMRAPPPHRYRRHDRDDRHHARDQERPEEQLIGRVADEPAHAITGAGQPDDSRDGRSQHRPQRPDRDARQRQPEHHRRRSASTRDARCRGILRRHHGGFGGVGHRFSRSLESRASWREHLADHPSGRT